MTEQKDSAEKLSGCDGVSRREFIKVGGAIAAAGAFLPLGSEAVWASAPAAKPLAQGLNFRAFSACLGQEFRIRSSLWQVPVRLVSTVDRGSGAGARQQQTTCFALRFVGPRSQPLNQNTYRFVHDKLGSFPLFIVPMGSSADGVGYEAVFNQLSR